MKPTKVLLALLFLVLATLGYFSYYLYQQAEELVGEIKELENQLESNNYEGNATNLWKRVDTAIYSREYDRVREQYKRLLEANLIDSNSFQMRLEHLEKVQQKNQSAEDELRAYRLEVKSLTEDLRVARNVNKLLAEDKANSLDSLFSIKQRADLEILNLRQKLRQKKTSIDSLVDLQKEVLRLKDDRGNAFYYFGPLKDGKANGKGIGVWRNGGVYEGEWKNNMRNGEGRFEWADGEVYEGTYERGKRSGKGTYIWTSGQKYVGEWEDDKRSGYGVLYNEYGNVSYKGQWLNDSPIRE
ncbi:MAG: hypothetical protein GVX78_02255 [Bacteroidetes bacterium]|jgi:hypothetical protein|nr:hypothetical protein [Bacteroidota bacterium]